MIRLAILASGGGSNMQAIVDAYKFGVLKGLAEVVLVISNNANAFVLERARKENIKSVCIERKSFKDDEFFNKAIFTKLQVASVDLVCLAGYMRMIDKEILKVYNRRILNIHPALLPKFGGKGMYGHFVHEAVVKAGVKKSGATVHFVNEEYDSGKIILQKEVEISKSDTPGDIAKKVLEAEHKIYPQAIKKVIEEKFEVKNDFSLY
ncbi:MAG: phosphoribosylglycinamide formyltransferase [Endomicrobium sp.]|jgi:phosphoribosylglycinamide formyltransferase-1|nr:phosphoribosylglycinamide formyltransferase [Endomicrobium sp.]